MSQEGSRVSQGLKHEIIKIPFAMPVAICAILILSYLFGFSRESVFQDWLVIANNALTMAVFSICLLLALHGEWRPAFALGVILAEVCRNLYVLLVYVIVKVDPVAQGFGAQSIFLILAMISIIMSIGVGRTLGMISGTLAIVVYALVALLGSGTSYFRIYFIQYAVIVAGGSLVTHYFRTYMLRLVHMRTDTLAKLQGLKESAEQWGEKNLPYITFGRNTAGLIHDFRNYVHVLTTNTQVQLLRIGKGKEIDPEALLAIEKKLVELSDRINLVTFATQRTSEDVIEDLVVQDLVRSVIYPFTISKEIRLNVELVSRVAPGLMLRSSREHVLRILENLVRNSCEAILEHLPEKPESHAINVLGQVTVEALPDNSGCTFTVIDTGPGLKTCIDCARHQACMDCSNFRIGKTTKSYGSGWGMVNVRDRIRELGGNFQIFAQAGSGTRIRIWIPHHRHGLANTGGSAEVPVGAQDKGQET